MMKKILNYQLFLEKLGIPSGNLELSEEIFDYIIKNLSKLKQSNIIDGPFQISDFKIDRILLDFNLIETDQVTKPTLISAGLESKSKSSGIYQFYDNSYNLKINLDIAIPKLFGILVDLKEFFINEKSQLLSTLSHELKHSYDHFKLNKSLSSEIGDYQAFSNIRFGLPSIDTFLFLVYFSSKIETSVYASEVGSLLRSNGVTNSEFKEFLTKTRVYDLLNGLSNFNYDDLFNTLLSDVDNIRVLLEGQKPAEEELPIDDRELIDYLLDLIVENITHQRIDIIRSFLPKKSGNNFMKIIFGMTDLEDGLEDYLMKVAKKITFKNNRDFFEYWEKKFKFVSNKMKKRLAKLYDMCPTKKTLLHQKINQKSIVNPELYDKLVTKTNLYPKK
jgi:hypothetical protein